jgi:asparaginyl-tRNA synthetase
MPTPISTIAEIGKHEGQSVTIRGWLYNLRESGKLLFPQFRDGSGVIQGVVPKNAVPPEVFDAIKGLTQESSVIVEGKVRADKRAPGGYELDVSNVQVVQRVPESTPYPITPKEHGVDFLMEHRHLWLRSQRQASILRVRAEIIRAARDFFDSNGFTLTDPPISLPPPAKARPTLFPVDYFEEQAYLTQSGQLYIEATAMALGKVYSFGPTFRAEKSKTRRHLTEFWMVEPEVAYGTLDDLMELAEGLLTFLVKRCLERRRARPRHHRPRSSPSSKKSMRPSRASPTTKPSQSCRRATPRACSKINSSGAETSARPTKPISHRSTTGPSWSIAIRPA